MNILVVAAHPDDEILGCGGTIAKKILHGDHVSIAILGEGITSRYGKREQVDKSLTEKLQKQAIKASEKLGISQTNFFSLPDNRFDTIPLLDIIKIVESLIHQIQPQTIYTHNAHDLNIDHQLTNKAVLTATRPLANCPVKDVYSFEIPSSSEWTFDTKNSFTPNVFEDIQSTLELKIEAMSQYAGESRSFPHPRSRESLRSIAQRWGSVSGFQAAEAFCLIRSLRPSP